MRFAAVHVGGMHAVLIVVVGICATQSGIVILISATEWGKWRLMSRRATHGLTTSPNSGRQMGSVILVC